MSGIELLLYRREAAVEVAEACPGESWIYTPHDVAMDVDVATPRQGEDLQIENAIQPVATL